MDLVDASRRKELYATRAAELQKKSEGKKITCFATSIWDETLYRVRLARTTLVPGRWAADLSKIYRPGHESCTL
jgi:Gtr1/RagA G protein conserved region